MGHDTVHASNERYAAHSVSNVEPAEIAARRRPCDLNGLDARTGLGRLVPIDARLDPGTVAFEDGFDASVVQVSHVPVEAQCPGLFRAIRAEVDALHETAEDDDRARLHALTECSDR